jgi:hypothetical protein
MAGTGLPLHLPDQSGGGWSAVLGPQGVRVAEVT